jgi:two-component system chemotaxis response regulator CheY
MWCDGSQQLTLVAPLGDKIYNIKKDLVVVLPLLNMKKILLIEDEEIIVKLLSKKLASIGYDVSLAMNGFEGLVKMKEVRPDLVLLDIVMPRMGGFEVMAEMKKNLALAKIPVIIISNSGQPLELEKAKALGAVDWLVKTEFDPNEVVEKIKKYTSSKD